MTAADIEARWAELRRNVVIMICVGLAVMLVFQAALAVGVFVSNQRVADVGEDNAASLAILRDATTPGGTLYERGQERTEQVVGALIARMDALSLAIINDQRASAGLPPLDALPDTKGP